MSSAARPRTTNARSSAEIRGPYKASPAASTLLGPSRGSESRSAQSLLAWRRLCLSSACRSPSLPQILASSPGTARLIPVPDHCCCLAPCAGHSVCAVVSCCHLTTAVSLSVTRAVVCPARPHLLLSAGLERERQASGSMLPVPPSVALAARAAALGRARRYALITSVPAARQGPSAWHVTGRRSQTSASQFGPKPRLSAVTARPREAGRTRPPGPFAVARSSPPSASSSRLLGLSQRETGSRSLSPGKSEEACSATSL